MSLAGKVALVTGASQGTGRAYALALAQAGATVVASSRTMGAPAPGQAPYESSLAQTVRLADELGYPVRAAICDVGNEVQITRTVEEIIGNFGRIDIIVNNAATYPADQADPHSDPFGFSWSEWDKYMGVNLIGPYWVIRSAAPYMIQQRSGSIINISSAASRPAAYGTPAHEGMLGYGVTKAALNRLTEWFAAEFEQYGIAVNALFPGAIVTNSWRGLTEDLKNQLLDTGLAKLPTVEVVGPPLLCLAKQTAEGLTGQVLDAEDFEKSWP